MQKCQIKPILWSQGKLVPKKRKKRQGESVCAPPPRSQRSNLSLTLGGDGDQNLGTVWSVFAKVLALSYESKTLLTVSAGLPKRNHNVSARSTKKPAATNAVALQGRSKPNNRAQCTTFFWTVQSHSIKQNAPCFFPAKAHLWWGQCQRNTRSANHTIRLSWDDHIHHIIKEKGLQRCRQHLRRWQRLKGV